MSARPVERPGGGDAMTAPSMATIVTTCQRSRRPRGSRLGVVLMGALLVTGTALAVPVAAQSPAPVSGGTLRFARNQEPTTLNPIGCFDNGCIWALTQIFDQLIDVTADGLKPG